jgi:methylated-DNA-[protein]-cysteine S-methyltransferase
MNARTVIDSPVGDLYLEASALGLRKLAFGAGKKFPRVIEPGDSPPHPEAAAILDAAVRQVREYFDGDRTGFDLPLDIEGTAFQKQVWKAISAIPYAGTISYKQLAEDAGSPAAFRAAGAACGANRIAIVIPCHRVVASDRSLHGFGGGLPAKRWLLDHEASSVMAGAARQAVLV